MSTTAKTTGQDMTNEEIERICKADCERRAIEIRQIFPTPWKRGHTTSDGETLNDANGKLILHVYSTTGDQADDESLTDWIASAVNAHDDLVAACETTFRALTNPGPGTPSYSALVTQLRAALAKARS